MQASPSIKRAGLRPSVITLGACSLLILFIVAIRLFHFGPFGIHSGDDVLLSHLALTNGSRLFVVAHRTEHLIDAYEVTLYRVEQDGKTAAYYLAHEDSYWWGCSMRSVKPSGEIEIRADGELAARYLADKDVVMLTDGNYPPISGSSSADIPYRLRRLLAQPKEK